MEIIATIEGIKYTTYLTTDLPIVSIASFNINEMPSAALLQQEQQQFAISKWVSPKRTRSYPYERVYNTFIGSKKITIIPIIKDEGTNGDRDFIQWDTVALMSLLDVYVILGYYTNADKHLTRKNKITNQVFDNEFIINKIKELQTYQSSALHWNLNILQEHNLKTLVELAIQSYDKIAKNLNVVMHKVEGLNTFKDKITADINTFKRFSRQKAQDAQQRELETLQPKEALASATKAKITITNYLGGQYFFTVDETKLINNECFLIESKYSKSALLPSISDIKDGLIKMMLYSNLHTVWVSQTAYEAKPVLKLTSSRLKISISSLDLEIDWAQFLTLHTFTNQQISILTLLRKEAIDNHFELQICPSK